MSVVWQAGFMKSHSRPRITYRKVHIFSDTWRLYQRWHTSDRSAVPVGARMTIDTVGNTCFDRLICQHPTRDGLRGCILRAREQTATWLDYGPNPMPFSNIPYGRVRHTSSGLPDE